MKHSQNSLDLLSSIQKTEVSDAVYENILAVIDSRNKNEPSVRMLWTYGIATGFAFVLSVGTVFHQFKTQSKISQLAENMNIIPNNSLYN